MQVLNLELELDYQVAGLKVPEKRPAFTGYILRSNGEYCPKRPAVLICPGGGYAFTSDKEATPIAMAFLAAGIDAFVLRYTCAPEAGFPTQLVEAAAAMRQIRSHAEEWELDEGRIAICGFSAGGHLAASLGVFWNSDLLKERGLGGSCCQPDGMVLCYPVITSGPHAHRGSFHNLLMEQETPDMLALTSLENQVTVDTPPAFLWHTWTDDAVPVQNTLLFASALADKSIPAEVHIYPRGGHGLSLANELVCGPEGILPEVQDWIRLAAAWVKNLQK